tara:strand:+ start:10399 stop:10644 length:246 start_codon:yes stop_codon:yes gene_type:complete
MTHRHKSVLFPDTIFYFVELVTFELGNRRTLNANQVLVHGLVGKSMFVPLEAFPEIVFLHQSTPHKKVESSIDRGLSYALS